MPSEGDVSSGTGPREASYGPEPSCAARLYCASSHAWFQS